ncbi:MAG: hypothetical protein SWH68_16300 [Thermodesulfobacteriota bacterium]|nr:hypothetical protein [Thermodesulfobacteriota bacterium]
MTDYVVTRIQPKEQREKRLPFAMMVALNVRNTAVVFLRGRARVAVQLFRQTEKPGNRRTIWGYTGLKLLRINGKLCKILTDWPVNTR